MVTILPAFGHNSTRIRLTPCLTFVSKNYERLKTVKELTDLLGPGIPLLVHNERKAADGSPVYKVCQTKVQVEIAKRFGFVEAAAEPVMSIKEEVAEPKKAPARRGRKPKAK